MARRPRSLSVSSKRPPRHIVICVSSLFVPLLLGAAGGQEEFKRVVLPVFQSYCYDCHADGVRKGKFALDEHPSYDSLLADTKFWDHVRQMLVTHVMPPVDKDAPSLPQRDAVVSWIDNTAFYADPAKPDPGHTVLRRLNRREYDNTVRDLLFIQSFKPADELPQDDTGYGFDNIGAVLTTSPMLMEKYLRAANRIRTEILRVEPPERASIEVGAAKFDRTVKGVAFEDDGVLWFLESAKSSATFYAPADGTYELRYRLAATPAGPDLPRMAFAIDGKQVGQSDVKQAWKKVDTDWQDVLIEATLKKGTRKLEVAFVNDFFDPQAPENRRDRNVALDRLDVKGPFGLEAPTASKFLRWLIPDRSLGLPSMELSGEDFRIGAGEGGADTGALELASAGWVGHPLEIHAAGPYQISVKLGAVQAGDEQAKFQVRLDEAVVFSGEVTAKNQAPQWFTFKTTINAGRHDLRVAFINDFYDEKTKADRNLWIHEARIEGPASTQQSLSAAEVPALVSRMGGRLFRRPLRPEETTQWRALATQALTDGEEPLGALGYVLEGMLVSPAFLYHATPEPAGGRLGATEWIDEYSLANRLSYFLWARPPSDELLDKAKSGTLRRDLPQVVKAMLMDKRSFSLAQDFAGQWLQLNDLEGVYRSKKQFPKFKDGLQYAMLTETQLFFDHILREDRSVMDFINADYTFANRKLAEYYELKDTGKFNGNDYRKVSLAGTPRGGLLTQGGILVLTSNPTRTNIVRRGKFVLESILGIPPPPVPGDVPPLNEDNIRFGHLTLRQQFEAHRHDKSCAGCHAFLDPMGFALESYDAIGRWRDKDHSQPIDSAGRWVRGQTFSNLSDVRAIIASDLKLDFIRCLSEHLLTYALGRGLEPKDRAAVTEIVRKTTTGDYKFQSLILAVCQSIPFQRVRLGQ